MKDYKYIIFDGQYLLVRNWKALIPRYNREVTLTDDNGLPILDAEGLEQSYDMCTLTSDDLVKVFFYSIAKVLREYASCRKVILCFDSAPYHKCNIVDDYKGSRTYLTEDDLLAVDKTADPLEYALIEESLKQDSVKREAKEFILENFNKLGMVILEHEGYEADDLAYLMAKSLELDDEKSCLYSIDGDWLYWGNKNVDCMKPNKDRVFKYDEMMDSGELGCIRDMGISLFEYKSYYDSLYGSHNDLVNVAETEDHQSLILECKAGRYNYVSDVELFKKQLKSFDILNYPEIDIVLDKIEKIKNEGSIMSIDEFELFRLINNFKVSTNYYSNFMKELDINYYQN